MMDVLHRVRCAECAKTWRENCRDCAEDRADQHLRAFGHRCELKITQEVPSMGSLMERTRIARAVMARMRGFDD